MVAEHGPSARELVGTAWSLNRPWTTWSRRPSPFFRLRDQPRPQGRQQRLERALRPCAGHRKITNGYRSQWSAALYADIRSVVETPRRRSGRAMDAIRRRSLTVERAHQYAEIEPGHIDQIVLVDVLASAQPRAAQAAAIERVSEGTLDRLAAPAHGFAPGPGFQPRPAGVDGVLRRLLAMPAPMALGRLGFGDARHPHAARRTRALWHGRRADDRGGGRQAPEPRAREPDWRAHPRRQSLEGGLARLGIRGFKPELRRPARHHRDPAGRDETSAPRSNKKTNSTFIKLVSHSWSPQLLDLTNVST